MVRPKSEHADENWLSSVCRSWAEWATSAASSAKRRSLAVKFFTFRFALRRARLKMLPSALVWSLIPRDEDPKARFNSTEKKISKRVGASTQPCFTPFLISNESDNATIILDSRPCVCLKRLHNVKASQFIYYSSSININEVVNKIS